MVTMPPKNSYTKLVRLVRRGNLHEANQVFADIMQQKSVDRLNEERKGLVTEASLTWWFVYLNGKEIDKVPYTDGRNETPESVKRSLVNHDGYDPRIVVRKELDEGRLVRGKK